MSRKRAIFERRGTNYVTYNNPQDAEVVNERFYLEKRLFGVRIFKKTWNQDSTILDRRAAKKTGFR